MSVAKHNWNGEIKIEYFKSEEIEVEAFLRTYLELDKDKPLGGDKKLATLGWRTEKENLQKEIFKKAIEELKTKKIQKAVKDLDIPVEFLLITKKLAILAIKNRLEKQNCDLPMGELVSGLNAVKIELGEEIVISKNKNTQQFLDKDGDTTNIPMAVFDSL